MWKTARLRLPKSVAAVIGAMGFTSVAVVDRRPMVLAGAALGALLLRTFLTRHRRRQRVTSPARLSTTTSTNEAFPQPAQ